MGCVSALQFNQNKMNNIATLCHQFESTSINEKATDESCDMFVCGLHTSGQTGLELFRENSFQPTALLFPGKAVKATIKSVHCGWYNTVLLSTDGRLWSCGAGYCYQSGHNQTANVSSFLQIKSIQHPIRQLSCGGHHTVALTTDGDLYVWGEAREGQLGLSEEPISGITPTFVPLSEFQKAMKPALKSSKIERVCCGGYHTLFILSNGTVYACGKNTYGQCGVFEDLARQSSLSISEEFRISTPHLLKEYEIDSSSKVIKYPSSSFRVVECAAGAWHSFLLTSEGKVFGFGDTQYGQLGLENRSVDSGTTYPIPHLIPTLQHERIASISCGYFHSVFLTRDGRIFTVGWNAYGQLMNGSTQTQRQIHLVKSLLGIPIHKVSCGWNHCVVVSRDGSCFVGGESKHGQLGHIQEGQPSVSSSFARYHRDLIRNHEELDNNFVAWPHILQHFKNISIRDVACGRGHTIFLKGQPEPSIGVFYSIERMAFLDLSIICSE